MLSGNLVPLPLGVFRVVMYFTADRKPLHSIYISTIKNFRRSNAGYAIRSSHAKGNQTFAGIRFWSALRPWFCRQLPTSSQKRSQKLLNERKMSRISPQAWHQLRAAEEIADSTSREAARYEKIVTSFLEVTISSKKIVSSPPVRNRRDTAWMEWLWPRMILYIEKGLVTAAPCMQSASPSGLDSPPPFKDEDFEWKKQWEIQFSNFNTLKTLFVHQIDGTSIWCM